MRDIRKAWIGVLAAMAVVAQQPGGAPPPSMKGVVRKNEAPVSKEILKVKLPTPVQRKLKNGLTVLVIENHRLPTMSLDLVLPGASGLNDPQGLEGLAEATAAMLKAGTPTRDSRQIADALSEIGATVTISSSGETAHIRGSALTENADAMFGILADILLNPTFPEDELNKWKARTLSRLQQLRASENFLGSERLRQILYPGDPRMIVAPSPDSIKKITRDNVKNFYEEHYRPTDALMGITGDVTTAQISAHLDKVLAKWEQGTSDAPEFALKPPIPAKAVYLVDRPGSVQTLLLLANRAISRTDPDYVACEVLNQVLGAGPPSRLFRNIREEKGFTYGVYSAFTASKYTQHFVADASVRTDVTGPAIDEFLKEFRDIRERPVPEDELDTAKRAIIASFALELERQASVLDHILTVREYGLPANYWDTFPAKVMAVTAADIQRVAKKYVPMDNLQLVAVGDASKIRSVLEKYGPVQEYSAEGKKISQ